MPQSQPEDLKVDNNYKVECGVLINAVIYNKGCPKKCSLLKCSKFS